MEAHRETKVTLTLTDEEADRLIALAEGVATEAKDPDEFATDLSDTLYNARWA